MSELTEDTRVYFSPWMAKILTEQTPYHAWRAHYRLGGKDAVKTSSPAKDFGTLVDHFVLGTNLLVQVKEPRANPVPGHNEIYVTQKVLDKARDCAYCVNNFLYQNGISLNPDFCQKKAIWQSSGGVWCKVKMDYESDQTGIIDLKTSHDLSESSIRRSVVRYGYDIQEAAYLEAMTSLGRPRTMRFLFVESKAPYVCRWVELDTMTRGEGTAKWIKATATWKECLETDRWPGWDNLVASAPAWAKKQTPWID